MQLFKKASGVTGKALSLSKHLHEEIFKLDLSNVTRKYPADLQRRKVKHPQDLVTLQLDSAFEFSHNTQS